jgi:hypothetical protein
MRCGFLILSLLSCGQVFAWGFFGHQKINEIAVYTLPKPLFGFYKANVDYIRVHATDPDNRRYVVAEEACRHYLDGDHYEAKAPFDTLPHLYKDACAKYTEDSILAHGIVPWHVQTVLYRLTEAFKAKDVAKILKLSADLGHYVGDLHVPLHSTSNYNGQKTNQKGIHALWESRLPELYFDNYYLFTGLAVYNETPGINAWQAFDQSYSLVDSVLKTEKRVSLLFPDEEKYTWEVRGTTTVRTYSKPFCSAYHLALGNMVENRLRASIILLGSLWYTAWVNAGQPDLGNMPIDEEPKEPETLPENGNMIGREEE